MAAENGGQDRGQSGRGRASMRPRRMAAENGPTARSTALAYALQ